MPNENETVLCLRCNSAMEALEDAYAIQLGRGSNVDKERIDSTKTILIQVLRCSNPDCDFIELKAPKRWPSIVPKQH